MLNDAQIAAPAGLRALGLLVQGLEEQQRLGHHLLAHSAGGLLVVLPEAEQLPAGQWAFFEGRNQPLGVLGVGARQGHQHPAGRPAGQLTGAHGFQHRCGQLLDEHQPAADPARMPAHAEGNLILAHPMGELQLPQQPGLLQHIKLPRPVADQKLAYRIGRRLRPNLRL